MGKWLVLFCDEINLPDMDQYGTQRVISFLRQLVEHRGFFRPSDQTWVTLERIQFVGACNPPTDPGRKPLSHRFLRHVPVIYVDYPGETSLKQVICQFFSVFLLGLLLFIEIFLYLLGTDLRYFQQSDAKTDAISERIRRASHQRNGRVLFGIAGTIYPRYATSLRLLTS